MSIENFEHKSFKMYWSNNGIDWNYMPDQDSDYYFNAYKIAQSHNISGKRYVRIDRNSPPNVQHTLVTFSRGIANSRPIEEILRREEDLPLYELELLLEEAKKWLSQRFEIAKISERKDHAIIAAVAKGLSKTKENLLYFVVPTQNANMSEKYARMKAKVGNFFILY